MLYLKKNIFYITTKNVYAKWYKVLTLVKSVQLQFKVEMNRF